MIKFFKDIFHQFSIGNTFQQGAALAYYMVFSFLPMIIIVTSVLGLFFGEDAVSGEIYYQLKGLLGDAPALQIQNIVKTQHVNHNSIWTAIIGFVTLGFSATNMLNQLHIAFNNIWGIKPNPKNGIWDYLSKHFISFVILITLFFILLVSTSINSFLVAHSDTLPTVSQSLNIVEHLISCILISILFFLMFKFFGDAIIYWKAALVGGIFTSFLFIFGKIGIVYYLSLGNISTAFGSASVLALIMVWVYYT
ncbi:YihY/virulence factor BrkB family protein, partial [Saprospiraceae bacterium]|nr:YihY/virulence factor BrkB family protein [Saprospiraceae bacterium]